MLKYFNFVNELWIEFFIEHIPLKNVNNHSLILETFNQTYKIETTEQQCL